MWKGWICYCMCTHLNRGYRLLGQASRGYIIAIGQGNLLLPHLGAESPVHAPGLAGRLTGCPREAVLHPPGALAGSPCIAAARCTAGHASQTHHFEVAHEACTLTISTLQRAMLLHFILANSSTGYLGNESVIKIGGRCLPPRLGFCLALATASTSCTSWGMTVARPYCCTYSGFARQKFWHPPT